MGFHLLGTVVTNPIYRDERNSLPMRSQVFLGDRRQKSGQEPLLRDTSEFRDFLVQTIREEVAAAMEALVVSQTKLQREKEKKQT